MGEEIKPLLVLHAVACEILDKRRKEKKEAVLEYYTHSYFFCGSRIM